MENERWPVKVRENETTAGSDRLNNGSIENGDCQSLKAGIKDEPENSSEVAEEVKLENVATCGPISEKSRQTIRVILDQIKSLSQIEKFLLYLKLPAEISNVTDPFRQPLNPLGSRSEIARTICWIQTHLVEDPDVSLPKQEVYNEYYQYCEKNTIKPLSQADFGKVMKQVYPKVRARRLGTRGNSRYCYSGLRRCLSLKPPVLPDLGDKPMSTEAPFTPSNLVSTAWLIVRDWSQQQLGVHFSSLQALAYYLVINHSIGAGSEAANKLTAATESKNEEQGSRSGSKHREMQLQLQRKIQQKHEGKERKRKMQASKCDPKPGAKKSRSASVPAPSRPTSPVPTSGSCSATSSASASPTHQTGCGPPSVCDTRPTTQLPDFNSFQRPPGATTIDGPTRETTPTAAVQPTKVAIPRLPQCQPAPSTVATPPKRKLKYKSIQPRLQTCDNASEPTKPVPAVGPEPRSQAVGADDCDVDEDFPLTRERLDSVSNVAKDAMDEYLGTNNSQHEEELSKYFSNGDIPPTNEIDNTKLSTLRQLLEQNGITDSKPPVDQLITPILTTFPEPVTVVHSTVQTTANVYVNPILSALPRVSTGARRRVSFETPLVEEAVPPSPNTRRKNFSFTPISPGPQSPNSSVQSKCSSANVSPFVSPRNTPVPRAKNTVHQNAGLKVKKELDLSLDLSNDVIKCYLPMSAPVSPMPNSSVLQKLLNANSKVQYSPGYNTSSSQGVAQQPEVNQFFPPDMTGRSQSVPPHQMVPAGAYITDQDFAEADPIAESDSDKVKRLISTLDETQCDNNNIDMFNLDLSSTNQEFGFDFSQAGLQFVQRSMTRSQSMDVGVTFDAVKCNPSRSVPGTPLPLGVAKSLKDFGGQNSRSYPSTPMNSEDSFTYNVNGDCLLNGRPIRADELEFLPEFDNNINQEKGFQLEGDFGMIDNGDGLLDETCILMQQGYNGSMN